MTCSVTALQKGKKIFSTLGSFQKPEIWQPNFQWAMPEVPSPDQCDDEEVRYSRVIEHPHSNRDLVKYFKE
jgi:acyl-CoA thioesterase